MPRIFMPTQDVIDVPVNTPQGVPVRDLQKAIMPRHPEGIVLVRRLPNGRSEPLSDGYARPDDTLEAVPANIEG
jgi:hypothetical protein